MSTTYTQIQKILASDGFAGDQFGSSVSISTHGHVALVGAQNHSSNRGSAYLFEFSDTKWFLQKKLTASDGQTGDFFGNAVALSADGNTALVDSFGDKVGSDEHYGSVYIFIRSDGTWPLQAKLTGTLGSSDFFGKSIVLSANGNIALVGIPPLSTATFFKRTGTTWVPYQNVTLNEMGGLLFGTSVALSASGNTALVGAPLAGDGSPGAVAIFSLSDYSYIMHPAVLFANDPVTGDNFGQSVSLSGHMSDQHHHLTALVGAPNANGNKGSAYVFTYADGTWPFQQKLVAADAAANDEFGTSVSLSADGNVALIGTANANKSYIFKRVSDVWTHFQTIRANDSDISINFGNAVALAGHGMIGLVGASAFSSSQGSAYFFGADPSFTPTTDSKTSLISFLPQVLIGAITLYTGIVSMFLYNAKDE